MGSDVKTKEPEEAGGGVRGGFLFFVKCRATCSSHDSCPGPEQHVLLLALESQGEKVLVSSQAHSRFPS